MAPCFSASIFVATVAVASGFQRDTEMINRAAKVHIDALQPDVAVLKANKYAKAAKRASAHRTAHVAQSASQQSSLVVGKAKFGDENCSCINIDNVKGGINLTIDGAVVPYPADLGASCQAWDDGLYPGCEKGGEPGQGNDWCGKAWCYVDPCKCNIGVTPKVSVVVPDGTYQGNPVYWSYATCGAEDTYTDNGTVVEEPTFCDETPAEDSIGSSGCKCIGVVTNVPGTIPVSLDGQAVEYPADLGHFCKAWDDGFHPSCNSSDADDWCSQSWCYVDPCSCDTEAVLSGSSGYLPGATFQGKPLYYSYASCGSVDAWTASSNEEACVLKSTESDCKDNKKCSWLGNETDGVPCVGKELAGMCSGAFHAGGAWALALVIVVAATVA